MSVTAYGNGGITLITQNNMLLSPMVTDYAPTAEINTTSSLIENVTMTGIDRIFKRQLSEADSLKLLNAFTVSGFMLDPTLNELDPNVANLEVSLSASGDFAAVIRDAITAATDASDDVVNYAGANNGALDAAGANVRLRQYLETRLRNAFFTYFASSLGGAGMTLNAGWTSGVDGTIMQLSGENVGVADEDVGAQTNISGGASGATPAVAKPQTSAIGATYAQAETTLTGFSVGVDVSETAMGSACALRHFAADMSENRRILFRQIRKATWSKYYDGSANKLNTNALPMEKGQSFVVVFDIDVEASSARADAGLTSPSIAETLPKIANSQAGDYSYQLDMGSRRVAFELQLSGAVTTGAAGAYTVGTGGLRVDTSKAAAPVPDPASVASVPPPV